MRARTKRLTELHMIRMSEPDRERLREIARELGLNEAELSRLALRAGLPIIRRKLPAAAAEQQ